MKRNRMIQCLFALISPALLAQSTAPVVNPGASGVAPLQIAILPREKPRVIVLTDIGNEPDDSMSLVRFLLYSNEYDVEGLVADTSTWLRNRVRPELIEERVRAYGEVLPNLRVHASGYPEMTSLLSKIRSGPAVYGMDGVGEGKDTEASKLIIDVVDKPDSRPVWISIWGGANVLAQALWTVEHTRKPEEVAKFVSKLRVYSISDQDDAGPWARAEFPKMWWIVSIHAFNEYKLATWTGINIGSPAPWSEMVHQAWLNTHVRIGPLGSLYPKIAFGMEGDTPSFLNLIDNGLSVPDHPEWGGWGGRYAKVSNSLGLWSDVMDTAPDENGKPTSSNQATIWRWRDVFQNDLAARIAWTLSSSYKTANHNPKVIVNGVEGSEPIEIEACPADIIHLSAAQSTDPDQNEIHFRWWQYVEATRTMIPYRIKIEGDHTPEVTITLPKNWAEKGQTSEPFQFQLILEVTDNGEPPLTSYRRIVLSRKPESAGNASCK